MKTSQASAALEAESADSPPLAPRRGERSWTSRLRRETSSGTLIPEIDGLRCVAIGAVVLHHVTAVYLEKGGRFGDVDLPRQWWEVFPKATILEIGYAGHFGVHLFFVISGFLLALPYCQAYRRASPRPSLRAYYLRRLIRIEPPYVLHLLLVFAWLCWRDPGWRSFAPHLAPSLFYLHGPIFGEASWINGVAWSLEVEVQFYLVLPLLAYVLAPASALRRRATLTLLMFGTAYAAQQGIDLNTSPRLALSLFNQLQFFFAGFLLADLYSESLLGEASARRVRFVWDGVAVLAAAAIYYILTRRYGLYWLTPALVVLLYWGVLHGRLTRALVSHPWPVAIGGMCYTIYLYHFPLLDLLAPFTLRLASAAIPVALDVLLQCVLLVPVVLLISVVLFVWLERPFLRWSREVSRGWRYNERPPS